MDNRIGATPSGALVEPVDQLLADVAIRIQLSRTNHALAVERYEAINAWLDRDGSPLKGKVRLMYPQGSMAIGATISARLTNDYFDIDLIAELAFGPALEPQQALDLLYVAIRGEKGSRYYHMVERCTRCVKVRYADGMELDVTPAVLLPNLEPKTSYIFHHRAGDKSEPSKRVPANPWGFAEWFKEQTPLDHAFAPLFEKRALAADAKRQLEKADADPVPAHAPAYQKSKAVIVLQLLKRWRNVKYDLRSGRRPPSIMLAERVASAANQTDTLEQELQHQSKRLLELFERAQADSTLVKITNPRCDDDVFTDRWPLTLAEQRLFLNDLRDLVAKVDRLVAGCDLPEMQEIMVDLFGEGPTIDVFRSYAESISSAVKDGQSSHVPGSGRIVAPAVVSSSVAPARPTVPHTFHHGQATE